MQSQPNALWTMLTQAPHVYIVGALLALALLCLVAAIVLLVRHHRQMQSVSGPVYNHIVRQARKRANSIIGDAMDAARELRVQGELRGVHAAAETKTDVHAAEEAYEKELHALMDEAKHGIQQQADAVKGAYDTLQADIREQLEGQTKAVSDRISESESELTSAIERLREAATSAEQAYEQVSRDLATSAESHMETVRQRIDQRLEKSLSAVEAQLQEAQQDASERMRTRTEEELARVSEAAEAYRDARYRLIDTQLLQVVEHVAGEVLARDISVSEHTALARSALEDAKSRGVFGQNSAEDGERASEAPHKDTESSQSSS